MVIHKEGADFNQLGKDLKDFFDVFSL